MKILALFPVILLFPAAIAFSAPSAGRISFTLGEVLLLRGKSEAWTPAKIALPVFENDAIKTGKASRCEIELLEDRVLRIDENTTAVLVTPNGQRSRIQASRGSVWVNVKKLMRKNSLEISTSVATAAIRGTVFAVQCDSIKSDFFVFKGTVEVLTADPKAKSGSFLVNAGEQFTIVTDLEQYLKDQARAFREYLEQSEGDIEQYQKEQAQALEDFQKDQEEKLGRMLEEERSAFQMLGERAACAKRSFDTDKINESDWVKWNQERDKALGW
jgi:hypothetical protein